MPPAGIVEHLFHFGIGGNTMIDGQFIHLGVRAHHGAIVIGEPAGIAHRGANAAEQGDDGDGHDGGGDQYFEECEAGLGPLCMQTLQICGTPVTGSMRTSLCAPRLLKTSMATAGAVPPGSSRNCVG